MKIKILFITLFLLPVLAFTQQSSTNSFESSSAFIENVGQFDGRNWQANAKIEYAIDYDDSYVFFSKTGLTYRFDRIIRHPDRDKSHPDSPKRTNISELIHVNWIGSNDNVEIIVEDEIDAYFSYAIKQFPTQNVINKNNIKGYQKLTYKNLYDNIDVEYVFHPENGFKYSIILHPGADVSQIKMGYTQRQTKIGSEEINYQLNELGQIEIKTSLGEILEHNPITFYANTNEEITSKFKFENDILSFELNNYDNTQEVVIDPWVESPDFNTSTAVWEVETDGSGNVYVIGGETPMELRKFNSAGAWQWTYVTPWDTANVWLGTLATAIDGSSFITSGTTPEIERVSNAGAMVWHNNSPSGGLGTEYWSITFNCDKTRLIVGGTGGGIMPDEANIYDIDITNGNPLATATVHNGGSGGLANYPIEVRSISSTTDAKYVFLTHLDVGAIFQMIGACPSEEPVFKVDNDEHLGYKCENYLPSSQNGGGLKALVANDDFFYTNTGDQIRKWDIDDGTLLLTVNLPGGNSSTPFMSDLVVENSGLAVDDCGNIYAGSGDRVVKFDEDLNILQQENVSFTVYDVSVNNNGEVLAVGAQSNNQVTNRNGKIESIDMNACDQFSLVCCDVNICPTDLICDYDPPFNIDASSPGGVFTGDGITDENAGTFDPSIGEGTYIITYTKPCGSTTIEVIVSPCEPIDVCENGTDYIASGGTNELIWYNWGTFNYPINTEQECIDCPSTTPEYMPLIGTYIGCSADVCSGEGWVEIGTGYVFDPANIDSWPIMITDGIEEVTFDNASEIEACDPCNFSINISSQDEACGGANGSATATASGGTAPYTYEWNTTPVQTTQTINGLSQGSYGVTVVDAAGCSETSNVTINNNSDVPVNVSIDVSGNCNGPFDLTANPQGYSPDDCTFEWNTTPAQTTQTITVDEEGTYSVTVTIGSCQGTANTNVAFHSLVFNLTYEADVCAGENAFAVVIVDEGPPPFTYAWSTGGSTTNSISVNTSGDYSVTVTDGSGCAESEDFTITVHPGLNLTADVYNISCYGEIDGAIATNTTGGTEPYTYYWSTLQTTDSIGSMVEGNYAVTVSDIYGCSVADHWYIDEPQPLVFSFGQYATICYGESTDLNVTVFGGIPTYHYHWSDDPTLDINSRTVAPEETTTYTVSVTDANGCITDEQSVIITVSPPMDLQISTTDVNCHSVCDGTATLNIIGGIEPFIYSWESNNETITGLCADDYSVTVTDNIGCSASIEFTITEPDTLVIQTFSSPSTCYGSPDGNAWIDAWGGIPQDTIDGDFQYHYNWSNGSQNDSIESVGAWYSVTITDYNGCTLSASVLIDQPDEIYVTPLYNRQICIGQEVSFSAYATGGNGVYNFVWTGSDDTEYLGEVITVDPLVTTSYTLVVTDGNGCIGNIQTVVVNVYPDIEILDMSLLQDSICKGEAVSVVFDINGGNGGPYTIHYENSYVVTSPHIFVPQYSGYYSYQVSDLCGTPHQEDSVYITVMPMPENAFYADRTRSCPPATFYFTEDSEDIGQNYLWDFGDGSYSVTKNTSHTYDDPGVYDITLRVWSEFGCENEQTILNMITVFPKPRADFIATPEVMSVLNAQVRFTNVTENGDIYFWHFGDGEVSLWTNQDPVHTYYAPGEYDVTMIARNTSECMDTTTKRIRINDVFTFYAPEAFSPNNDGINDYFFVTGHGIDPYNFQFAVFDRWGNMVFETSVFKPQSPYAMGWDGTDHGNVIKGDELLPVGAYSWHCSFLDLWGNPHEESGVVNIIR